MFELGQQTLAYENCRLKVEESAVRQEQERLVVEEQSRLEVSEPDAAERPMGRGLGNQLID